MLRCSVYFFLIVLFACSSSKAERNVEPAIDSGKGWRTTHLDLFVDLVPGKAPVVRANLTLLLDAEASYGPSLVINSMGPTARFGPFEVSGHEVHRNQRSGRSEHARYAHVRRATPYGDGDTLRVQVPVELVNNGSMLHTWSMDFILASWVNVWYPAPIGWDEDASWTTMKPLGKTVYKLPVNWDVVSSGTMDTSFIEGKRRTMVWSQDGSTARSFAAGPFQRVSYWGTDTQPVELVGTRQIYGQEDRVTAFLHSIEILEEFFGPSPYPYHSIVEVPSEVPGFYGASEQNFILLKSQAFDDPLTSLPVLAHEAAHAWWAIAVGVEMEGEGALFMTESMAQYGAILAIEKVHGPEAAKEFMWSGKGGFSTNHHAGAYFRMTKQDRDIPLMSTWLGQTDQHYIADSKGAWVYHMLRGKVGDEAFFRALRSITRDYAGRTITIGEWCDIFDQNTELDLTRFFEQWLEWEGVPQLSIGLSEDKKGAVLQQTQSDGNYELDLQLQIDYADGSAELRELVFNQERTSIVPEGGKEMRQIVIDPNRDLLLSLEPQGHQYR